MPNHITNIVRVRNKEEKAKVLEVVKSDDKEFDFERILPFPEELKDTQSPSRPIPDEEFAKLTPLEIYNPDEPHSSRKISVSESKRLIAKYGTDNWYDWNCANWGTKWNAYHHDNSGDDEFIFDTAWSHPFPVIEALSKMFPEITFTVKYADEDIGSNFGYYEITNGETEDLEHEIDDEERFCIETKGYDYDDWKADQEEGSE